MTSRRSFLTGCAALSAAVITPEIVRAAALGQAAQDWSLASRDLEGDVARHAMTRLRGRAPAGLEGTLFRNGPGKFRRAGGSATHWFDGDGLMRAFRVSDGRATLEARFADTPKRRWETEMDAVVTPGFGTVGDARARLGSNDDANAANTSVMAVGDKVWALWEGGSPMAMSGDDLATEGFVTLRDDLKGMPFQAHPRRAPDGTVWCVGSAGDRAVIWALRPDGGLIDARVVALPRASYMHDFTATHRHLIFVLQPWVFARETMPFTARLDWRPEMGTQVFVVDKDDVTRTRIFDLPSFSHFHLGDAWEEADGTIRFDVSAGPDVTFAIEGARVIVQGHGTVPGEPNRLAMVTLHADGRADFDQTETVAEFVKGDPRREGLSRDLSVHLTGDGRERPLPNAVALRDWGRGETETFVFGDRQVVEEAIFVPKPGRSAERDAWLVVPSIDLTAARTELHVLDAARIADGPVVSWRADVALPAGFHGTWRA
ncbi:carotenoid oxygenase family protein [Brevundimonas sp.]|jgi:carotenoid cleavage dioxygenase-like enzyme|uniref:carotenoid oxygenase family protein n=1 Tax=Brevundimonas sp. TaxID=1871086 RepID=UPI002E1618C1|nr:carotenoid oxygenase family protein [Brevundimonas sp.]